MLKQTIVLSVLILTATSIPVEEDNQESNATTKIVQLERDLNFVAYVQNFKHIMAEYVNSQYRNLTVHEMEKVKITLEEFLKKFAEDLKEVVGKQDEEFKDEFIEDTLPDSTFDEIKNRMRTEFPDLKENTAKEIVFRLRKNLYSTRQKIDDIIKESQRSQLELSQE